MNGCFLALADCPVKNVMFTKAEFDGEWCCWQLLAFLAVSYWVLPFRCCCAQPPGRGAVG